MVCSQCSDFLHTPP